MFKEIIDKIFESEGKGYITHTFALNDIPTKLRRLEIQQLLNRLHESQWISFKTGKITLAMRSYLELRPFLDEIGKGLECHLCKEIGATYIKCNCSAILHPSCANVYLRKSRTCPSCRTPFTEANLSAVETDSSSQAGPSTPSR
eukprot:TRINITY_DN806_c0_g1_i3.p1 TRINITY_DN806_c0_g1~~TRINITY_DN806_c0_g1_i3.p1  ORF type:complete len:144 (+),score=16.01 TRINITY_DN806_c0_g1_i3:341-772(+)